MLYNIEKLDIEGVQEVILLLDSSKVNMLILEVGLHPNIELISEFVILNILKGSLSGSMSEIWGNPL